MRDFWRVTLGWYRAVLAPNIVTRMVTLGLLVGIVLSLALHYTIVGPRAATVYNFSGALVLALTLASVLSGYYGLMRGLWFHPALDYRYHDWLLSTPWAPGAPLPKGPIMPTWQDGVFLTGMTIFACAYAGQTGSPEAYSLGPATAMAAGYALSWSMANLVTRNLLAVYAALFTAPAVIVVLFWTEDSAITAGAVASAIVAYWGVAQGLKTYPWNVPPKDKDYLRRVLNPSERRGINWQPFAEVGWPYAQLLDTPRDFRVPRLRAAIEALTVGAWAALVCLYARTSEAWIWVMMAGQFLVVAKLIAVAPLFCSRLCIGERFAKRKPIVWRHDRLLVNPILLGLSMFLFGFGWHRLGIGPAWLGAAITVAIGVWLCRRLGPSIEEGFYTGPQSVRGVSMQRPHFERLAAPGD